MSTRPHASRVLATRFSSCALSEMRVVCAIASPPFARIAAATSSHGAGLRAEITTRPPASAIASAIARPMPRLEPVTIATFPDKSNKFIVPSDQRLRRPIMPHRAIFRNRIIIAILFRPVARCGETRLADRVAIFPAFEFGSKNRFNRLRYAVCRVTRRLSGRKRSSHEYRKYRKGHRSAAGNQDHRKLCGQSYTVTRTVAGPDHLGAAGSARSRKTGAGAGAAHAGGADSAVRAT